MSPSETSPLPSSSVFVGAALSRVITGAKIGVVTSASAGAVWSLSASAVLRIWPAVTSAAVTTYVPVSTQVAFGATVAQLVVFGVTRLSLTTTLVSVAAPVFVIVTV